MAAHEEVGRLAAKSADLLITLGTRAKFIAESARTSGMAKKRIFAFTSMYEAGMQLQQKILKEDVILIKGSQGVRMERIVKEVMAEPIRAEELLVRQSKRWSKKTGLYD